MQAAPQYQPPQDPIEIIYQDNALLVVNKPAGLLSVPGKTEDQSDCLEARLRAQFRDTYLVHRLDMDTSGLIVFARKKRVQRHLNAQFENRTVKKTYVALVSGEVLEDAGRINLAMRTDWPNRPLQMIADDGKPAITDWKVLERGAGFSRVELRPETGRTHQLRLHMKAIGHPILGDRFYADAVACAASDRLCLHAKKLSFEHTDTKLVVSFESSAAF